MGCVVRREWEPEGLVEAWTLVDDDWELVANKTDATRLGFCLLLKFFELEARFPRHAGEIPKAAGRSRSIRLCSPATSGRALTLGGAARVPDPDRRRGRPHLSGRDRRQRLPVEPRPPPGRHRNLQ